MIASASTARPVGRAGTWNTKFFMLQSTDRGGTIQEMRDDVSSPTSERRRTGTEALASGFIPGVGQLLQGRPVAAAVQFVTVVAYVVIGSETGLRHAMFLALAWNCYSVIDAYRYRAD